MFSAILKSIKENEARHIELRQMVADFIEQTEYDEEEIVFKEENCKSKKEYLTLIRKNGEYTNDIILETISKKTNILFGI